MDRKTLELMISDYLNGTIESHKLKQLKSVVRKSKSARQIFQKMAGQEMALYQLLGKPQQSAQLDTISPSGGSINKRASRAKQDQTRTRSIPRSSQARRRLARSARRRAIRDAGPQLAHWITLCAGILITSALMMSSYCCSSPPKDKSPSVAEKPTPASDNANGHQSTTPSNTNQTATSSTGTSSSSGAQTTSVSQPASHSATTASAATTHGRVSSSAHSGMATTSTGSSRVANKPSTNSATYPAHANRTSGSSNTTTGSQSTSVTTHQSCVTHANRTSGSSNTTGGGQTTAVTTTHQRPPTHSSTPAQPFKHSSSTAATAQASHHATGSSSTPPSKSPVAPGSFKVLHGKVVADTKPRVFPASGVVKVVKAVESDTTLLLPDASTVTLQEDTSFAVMEGERQYALIEGEADFKVQKSAKSQVGGSEEFNILTRVGEVEVLGTEFHLVLQELQPQRANARPGDNPACLGVKVMAGKVGIQQVGFKRPKILMPGQQAQLRLSEVRRDGVIQAVGLGMSRYTGVRGRLMRQQAARNTAARELYAFSKGIHFTARVSPQGVELSGEIQFDMQGMVMIQDSAFMEIGHGVTLCVAKAKITMAEAEKRRNLVAHQAQGRSSLARYPNNFPMAFHNARLKAIAKIIAQGAREVYRGQLPPSLSGTFYPLSCAMKFEGNDVIADVRGEALFE